MISPEVILVADLNLVVIDEGEVVVEEIEVTGRLRCSQRCVQTVINVVKYRFARQVINRCTVVTASVA